jgi:hypothetical protein
MGSDPILGYRKIRSQDTLNTLHFVNEGILAWNQLWTNDLQDLMEQRATFRI